APPSWPGTARRRPACEPGSRCFWPAASDRTTFAKPWRRRGRGAWTCGRASRARRESRTGACSRRCFGRFAMAKRSQPDERGHFGPYGGRFVPETLMAPLEELARAYDQARKNRAFRKRLENLLETYAGRPTPLYFAERLSEELGGARIYLKREDLLHTGAHKINNAIGQALLAESMG